jgi:hypothetical protein
LKDDKVEFFIIAAGNGFRKLNFGPGGTIELSVPSARKILMFESEDVSCTALESYRSFRSVYCIYDFHPCPCHYINIKDYYSQILKYLIFLGALLLLL